jgi:hypothetical protein
MSDDTTRRDAWRDAQAATTVTGEKPETHRGRTTQEHAHEDHVPHGSKVTDPENAA